MTTDEEKPEEKKPIEWGKLALGIGKALGKGAVVVGKELGKGAVAAGKEIGKAIDDMEAKSKEASKLEQHSGSWTANAPAPVVFEAVYKQFATKPIGMPPYRWNSIRPVQEYMQIFFEANWSKQDTHWTHQTHLNLELTFQQQNDGTTVVQFQYQQAINNLMELDSHCSQLIRNSNKWIREICKQFG